MAATIAPGPRRLLQILGVAFGLAVVFGNMVGSGILRAPGPIAGHLGDATLILLVWLLAGVYTLNDANVAAELAAAVPRAGGPYVYVRRAFGDFWGLVAGMGDVTLQTCGIAYFSVATGEYLGKLFPALLGRENLIAPVMVLTMAIVNSFGLRQGSILQQGISLLKALLLMTLVVAALTYVPSTPSARVAPPSLDATSLVAVVLGLQLALEAYGGWNAACYFCEETRDPGRAIPRALLTGIVVVMVVYVSINLALLHVLTPAELAASKLPAATAMERVFGAGADQAVTVLAIVSIVGICNTVMLVSPRILYGLGRDGLSPRIGTYVTRGGTPLVSLWIIAAVSLVFAVTGSFETLFAIGATLNVITNLLVGAALFALRRREPDLPRPYRAFGYPWLPAISLAGAGVLLVAFAFANPRPFLVAIAGYAVAWPLFVWARRRSIAPVAAAATDQNP